MKAMIFAAGLGTRLRPLTDSRPKALVEVAGKEALARVIDKLRAAGTDSFVINVHHFPDMIRRFVADRYPDLDVEFSDESSLLLDTGGGLVQAASLLDGEPFFMVHNADIITDFPIREMVKQHVESCADVTLLTSPRDSARRLMFDADGRLRGWQNVKTGEQLPADADFTGCRPLAFGGVHIISRGVLAKLADYGLATAPDGVFSIVPFYASMAGSLDIRAYMPSAPYRWFDIGSTEKLAVAEAALTEIS